MAIERPKLTGVVPHTASGAPSASHLPVTFRQRHIRPDKPIDVPPMPKWAKHDNWSLVRTSLLVRKRPVGAHQTLPITRNAYVNYLRLAQLNKNKFPWSDGPVNPYDTRFNAIQNIPGHTHLDDQTVYEDYKATGLTEYEFNNPAQIVLLDEPKGLYAHHKLHLNVLPENVVLVSNYLKTNGIEHKYFSGGELGDGKVFTIYCGSITMAAKVAGMIARDLNGKLCHPSANSEIEYAPNVSGRFDIIHQGFGRYPVVGTRGVNSLENDKRRSLHFLMGHRDEIERIINSPEYKEFSAAAFDRSLAIIIARYGDYFHGSQEP